MVVDLLSGLAVSVEIFVLTLAVALPLGLVVALGRMSKSPVVSGLFRLYISVVRGTPLMLQIIFVYFAPYFIFGMPLASYPRLLATVIAFGLNYGAYFAEIYRGGILSIDPGQREAAAALGFPRTTTFMRIILPQVVKRVLLPVCNEVITLIKDTALASTVAVVDLMTVAKKQVSSSSSIEPYLVAIIMYLILNGVAEQLCKLAEKKMDYYR